MKSVIILDLDATLVNTFGDAENWIEVNDECRDEQCKRLYNVKSESGFLWGAKRPHLDHFLATCFDNFDVVGVWSAGSHMYVNEIVIEIFRDQQPDFVWSKEDCVSCYVEWNETYVRSKPLAKIWDTFPHFDKKRTLLIDDAEDVCIQNPLNHILIPPWTGSFDTLSKPDEVLLVLSAWIEQNAHKTTNFRTVKTPDLSVGFHNF
jgi:TFIIF-interacting CTD phosphatase-like protein